MVLLLVLLYFASYASSMDNVLNAIDASRFRKATTDTGFRYTGDICANYRLRGYSFSIYKNSIFDSFGKTISCTFTFEGKTRLYKCEDSFQLYIRDNFMNISEFNLSYNLNHYYVLGYGNYQLLIDDIYDCNDLDVQFCPAKKDRSCDNYAILTFASRWDQIQCICNGTGWNCPKYYEIYYFGKSTYFIKDGVCYPTHHTYQKQEYDLATPSNKLYNYHTFDLSNNMFLEKFFINNIYYCVGNEFNDDGTLKYTYNVTLPCEIENKNILCKLTNASDVSTINTDEFVAAVKSVEGSSCELPLKSFVSLNGDYFAKDVNENIVELKSPVSSIVSLLPTKLSPFYYLPNHRIGSETFSEYKYTNEVKIDLNRVITKRIINLKCVSTGITDNPRYFYRHYQCTDEGRSQFEYNNHMETYFGHGFDSSNLPYLYKEFDVFYDGNKYYLRMGANSVGFYKWTYEPGLIKGDGSKSRSISLILIGLIFMLI